MISISNQAIQDYLSRQSIQEVSPKETTKENFLDYLKDSFLEVNESQKTADQMAQDLATGKDENIHETMLAMSQAELGFQFLVQVRNKVIESYQEIMRLQV